MRQSCSPLAPLASAAVALVFAAAANGRGVSPYLPLSLDPALERDVERVLILADRPVISRPIAAATVRDALPRACAIDRPLCERVGRYLASLMPSLAITHLSIEGAATSSDDDADVVVPNRHGLTTDSAWVASARAHWQPFDHALLSVGGVAYDGEATPTGSLLSLGFDVAQLDIGYREHHFSPFTDSAMLISAHAPAMPSVTLSNYRPLTRLGLRYEFFVSQMSESDRIVFANSLSRGRPKLSGAHLSIEPAPGFSLGVNRLLQFGGGARGGQSIGDFVRAFWNPSRFDNADPSLSSDAQFGNQLASYTSRLVYPGRVPFALYFEYAGEDTARGRNHLLGNSSLSVGLDVPRLPWGMDATIEVSDWQNAWYVNSIYGDGLTNEGRGLGHWFVDRRRPGDAVDGQAQMVRLGWAPRFAGAFEFRYRTSQHADYSGFAYPRTHEVTAAYSRSWRGFRVGGELLAGRNELDESFTRAALFFRYAGEAEGANGWLDEPFAEEGTRDAHFFVAAGTTYGFLQIEVDRDVQVETERKFGPHFAVGVRRRVSDRSDFGARLEIDDIESRALLGVRAVDYRFRASDKLAYSGFIGAARYDLATAAYGIYLGIGAEWRDFLPGWSAHADLKYASKVARDRLLPEDQGPFIRDDVFYDIASATLAISRRF